jgi:hypothetical protein
LSAWSTEDLAAIGDAEEVRVASRRADGTLRKPIRIWVVRVGDDLYVRSAYGLQNPWYVRAVAAGAGRITVGKNGYDVMFVSAGRATDAAVTAAYHAKYDRYGVRTVGTVVSREAEESTLRLLPMVLR